MAEQEDQYVTLSHGRVHYRCAGLDDDGAEDRPAVILVHGFSFASWCFNALGPLAVAAGYRVYAPDLYGRGFSDRPAVTHDRGLYNRMLSEFMDAVGLDEPVILVGNSMGGAVVTDFAAHHPGQVRGLLLLVPARMLSPPKPAQSPPPSWPSPQHMPPSLQSPVHPVHAPLPTPPAPLRAWPPCACGARSLRQKFRPCRARQRAGDAGEPEIVGAGASSQGLRFG